jgi:hypothetical protein
MKFIADGDYYVRIETSEIVDYIVCGNIDNAKEYCLKHNIPFSQIKKWKNISFDDTED